MGHLNPLLAIGRILIAKGDKVVGLTILPIVSLSP
jgi:hypothetical protein